MRSSAPIAFLILLIPTIARAEEHASSLESPSAVHLRAEAGTDFPLDVGARLAMELPYRLRVSTTFGFLPRTYVGAANGVLVGVGAYSDATGSLIREGLKNAFVMRTHVGWRPFPREGAYFDVGYGLVGLGGGTTAASVVDAVTGLKLPPSDGADRPIAIKSLLHMVDVELGWEFFLSKRFTLRTALGGAFTVGSSTSVIPHYTPFSPEQTAQYTNRASAAIDHIYRSYVFTPVLSVTGGYAFF